MKHIKIRNFGPLRNVDIDLSQINLIIGLQSSGKSCDNRQRSSLMEIILLQD